MKRLLLVLIFLGTNVAVAQESLSGGINIGFSSNVGFVGIMPQLSYTMPFKERIDLSFNSRAFIDLGLNNEVVLNQNFEEFHRSAFIDVGINLLLVDRYNSWTFSFGPSLNFNHEKYVSTYSLMWDEIRELRYENNKDLMIGYYVSNSISFGKYVALNVTIHGYDYLGEYITFGPSIKFD